MTKYDPIMAQFGDRAIKPGGIEMFTDTVAIEVVQKCKSLGYRIVAIDAFFVSERYTQPTMEHSIDFTYFMGYQEGHGFWDEAEQYLRSKTGLGLFFEVVYYLDDHGPSENRHN